MTKRDRERRGEQDGKKKNRRETERKTNGVREMEEQKDRQSE